MSETLFIMVSPPRTGTTSLSKMAEMVGIKPLHVLRGSFRDAVDDGCRFFSDTPFYIPEFLCGLLEASDNEFKFIYSHRDQGEWMESMRRMRETWSPKEEGDKKSMFNRLCYDYLDTNKSVREHRHHMRRISDTYGIEMLDYRLGEGWDSFCRFVGKDVPEAQPPHLNRKVNKPFDEY